MTRSRRPHALHFAVFAMIIMAALNLWLDPAKPAPIVRSINYETMADCVAEQSYVRQYNISMQQLEDMLRVCGTFSSKPLP